MPLKTALDRHTENPLQQPATDSPAAELVNHETLWLKNFLSKQTQQTYRAVFREFCQLGQITSPEALRQVTPAAGFANFSPPHEPTRAPTSSSILYAR